MTFISRLELMAKEEGAIETAREAVTAVLQIRFESFPPNITEMMNSIEDLAVLKPDFSR